MPEDWLRPITGLQPKELTKLHGSQESFPTSLPEDMKASHSLYCFWKGKGKEEEKQI